MARFTGFGNHMEAPALPAGICVKCSDVPADAVFAAGGANDHFVFHYERRDCERVIARKARVGRFDLDVENLAAGFRVDRNQVRVDSRQVKPVALNGETLIVSSATGSRLGRSVRVCPVDSTGGCIQRDHLIGGDRRLHRIHHAVNDERRCFEFRRAVHGADLQDPLQFEVLHVVRSYLIQKAVPLIEKSAAIGEPVLRLFVRVQNSLEWDLLS